MATPDTGAYRAAYADGKSARRHDVLVMLAPGMLEIRDLDGTIRDRWPFAAIRTVTAPRRGEPGVLQGGADGRARLTFDPPVLLARLREAGAPVGTARYGDGRLARLALFWSFGAIAALAAVFLVLIPMLSREIAAVLPRGLEARLGDRYVDLVARMFADDGAPGRLCVGREGRAQLEALVARLQSVARVDPPPVVTVINGPMVNAFALPGSRLVVMRGLIGAVESPDELAAVLAHELAHVVHRHPTETAVKRTAGSFVVGLLMGDAIGVSVLGSLASQLLTSAYSREAEAAADATGLRILDGAGIDAAGFVRFMARMAELEGATASGARLLAHFSTHPPSEARAAAARAQAGRGGAAMGDGAWRQLKGVCSATR